MPACPKCGSPLVTPLNCPVCKTTFARPLSFAEESVPAGSPLLSKELQLDRRLIPRAQAPAIPAPAHRPPPAPTAPPPTKAENSWLAPPGDSPLPKPAPLLQGPKLGSTRPSPSKQAPAPAGPAPARPRQEARSTPAVRPAAALPPPLPVSSPAPAAAKTRPLPVAVAPPSGDEVVESRGPQAPAAPPSLAQLASLPKAPARTPARRAPSPSDTLPAWADPPALEPGFAEKVAEEARAAAAVAASFEEPIAAARGALAGLVEPGAGKAGVPAVEETRAEPAAWHSQRATAANPAALAEPRVEAPARGLSARGEAAGREEEIHAEPGGVFAQLGAWLVDAVVLGALFLLYLFAAQVIAGKIPPSDLSGLDWLIDRAFAWKGVLVPGAALLAALSFVYSSLFHALGGRTLGKRLFGLTLVDSSGLPPRLARSAARSVLVFASAALLLMGFVLVLFDRKRQALHDKLTGTFVVRLAE